MLNEHLELRTYITDPETDNPRLQPKLFTENFAKDPMMNGLEDVLTVIARGFIFSEDGAGFKPEQKTVTEELVQTAVEVLQRWCGFSSMDNQTKGAESETVQRWFAVYPDAEGWLKRYCLHHYERIKKGKAGADFAYWKNAEKKWSARLAEGDYRAKSISYRNVVANALEQGPLCERYLAIKKDAGSAVVKEKDRFSYLYTLQEGASKPNRNTKAKLLKNIAAYLILQQYHPQGQQSVLLGRGRLMGWYGQDDGNSESKLWVLPGLMHGQEKIFSREIGNPDFIKFFVNGAFLQEYDARLIEKEQVEVYREAYWILKDVGHGEPLQVMN